MRSVFVPSAVSRESASCYQLLGISGVWNPECQSGEAAIPTCYFANRSTLRSSATFDEGYVHTYPRVTYDLAILLSLTSSMQCLGAYATPCRIFGVHVHDSGWTGCCPVFRTNRLALALRTCCHRSLTFSLRLKS